MCLLHHCPVSAYLKPLNVRIISLGTILVQIFLSVFPFQTHSDFEEIQIHTEKKIPRNISEPIWSKFSETIALQGIPGMIPMGVSTVFFFWKAVQNLSEHWD